MKPLERIQGVDLQELRLSALGVSKGVGIGQVVFLRTSTNPFSKTHLTQSEVEIECRRFDDAVRYAKHQLNELSADTEESGSPVSDVLDVHKLILDSPFTQKISETIRSQQVNAEWALKTVSDLHLAQQMSLSDERFRNIYLDIEDVANRLLRALRGTASSLKITSDSVVAARDLRPSTVLEIAKCRPAAIVTEIGGWTSHSSIIARECGVPMITGVKEIDKFLRPGRRVLVNGSSGTILLDPDRSFAEREAVSSRGSSVANLPATSEAPAVTRDGIRIVIRANVESPDAYRRAHEMGAAGIGLFRSESLISDFGLIPSEEDQFNVYRSLAELANGANVRIRTFDTGSEIIAGRQPEPNPALGLCSIRLGLKEPKILRNQLRAILRASVGNSFDIILPMVSDLDEVHRSRALLSSEREKLLKRNIPVGDPNLGIMVELPSVIMMAREFARAADFLCLGTNDLVQYVLGVDRDNDEVAHLYQTLHPAVLRSIKAVFDGARAENKPVTVCGEMAASPFYVPVLIGLGARELSMNGAAVPGVRDILECISSVECSQVARSMLDCATAAACEDLLRSFYSKQNLLKNC